MKSVLSICLAIGLNSAFNATAATLYESGTLGQPVVPRSELTNQNVFGTNVNANVFAGVRFELTMPAQTTEIGGHFVGNGTLFGAVVELDDANDFPNSEDLTTADVLGYAALNFSEPSAEVFGNLELLLNPGWYALVFGTGLFGTSGDGVAVRNGLDIDSPQYIIMGPNFGWFDSSTSPNHRFILKGSVIPEPSAILSLLIGTAVASSGLMRERLGTRDQSSPGANSGLPSSVFTDVPFRGQSPSV